MEGLSSTQVPDSATTHRQIKRVSYHLLSTTTSAILSARRASKPTSSIRLAWAETTWGKSLSKTSRKRETTACQDPADTIQIKDFRHTAPITPWPLDCPLSNSAWIRVKNYQDQDPMSILKSQVKISCNLRSKLRASFHLEKLTTDSMSQLIKLVLQLRTYTSLWITWMKITTQHLRRLSRLLLEKTSPV
jgi:hypothetical protein